MDFNDLLFNAVRLFQNNPQILERYSNIYKYIMVDEFQDTNYIQDKLIKLLAGKHKNICVVGDDDQSIYSFRGATIDNILSFEKTYPGCSVIKLERNYRSTKNILNAASALVKGNKIRKDKTLKTDKKGGGHMEYGSGNGSGLPEFSTFHSFCLKLLRRHADLAGYERSFVVFDEDDSGKIISKIIKSLNLNEKIITPSKAKYFIERNKNSFINAEESFGTVKAWEKDYAVIYSEYSKKLKESNAMDFNDLLFNAVKLFQNNPQILERYSNLYKYIMVDEFQDTNYIQDKLIKLLAGKHIIR